MGIDKPPVLCSESIARAAFVALLLAAAAVAMVFRVAQLEARPMHGDEANQAFKTGVLLEKGEYRYDPYEHHGPTLYYLTLIPIWLSGARDFAATSEWMYRIVPAVFGVGLVLLCWPMASGLGRGAALWAAVLSAVSHGLVYYSRYYIQETLFVFFIFAAIACGWWYCRRRSVAAALMAGVCVGLVHATKETCVVVFAAMAGAVVLAWGMAWWRGEVVWRKNALPPGRHVAVFALAAALVSVTLFTSFFTHWRGPLDSLLTYTAYFSRAEGAGSSAIHDKPWYYYLQLLAYTYRTAGPRWSEAPVLVLACAGLVFVWRGRSSPPSESAAKPAAMDPVHLQRFLLFYAVLLTLAFSLIPYKTPWNMLAFYHAVILLAGLGAAALVRLMPRVWLRGGMVVLLLLPATFLARQSCLGNFRYPADVRNPYVYAHTSTSLLRLVKRVEEIAAVHPDARDMQVNVIREGGDYWPLPWYLRAFPRVGYWTAIPDAADAPMIIASAPLQGHLAEALEGRYFIEYHALRPGVLLHAYIRQDLWDRFIASRSGV